LRNCWNAASASAPRYERFNIRRRVFANYLIFHRIAEESVEVIHVLHGARDYEPLLFPEEPR
jgi:plasmid stabilization system protein ParE